MKKEKEFWWRSASRERLIKEVANPLQAAENKSKSTSLPVERIPKH